MIGIYTAERVSKKNQLDNYLIQRHFFAYSYAASRVYGTVMEVGCGEGYGYDLLGEKVNHYVGVDKTDINSAAWQSGKADFFKMKVPLLKNIPSNIFDFVISFQVIEHIKDDTIFIEEIHRVLKKGGTLLLSTPNKKTSFTRNPWHIREYEAAELAGKISPFFSSYQVHGLNASASLKEYLLEHKAEVDRILRYDILKLEQKLPKALLKIPYNILNQVNKLKVYQKSKNRVNNISQDDFILGNVLDDSLDLVVEAVK